MNTYHEEEYRGCTIRLEYDRGAESPRDWCNVGTMVCWHRRYNLGDEQPKCGPSDWFRKNITPAIWDAEKDRREQEIRARYAKVAESGFTTPEQHEEHEDDLNNELDDVERTMENDDALCQELFDKDHVRLPLYLYDHSGITMSTGRFSCPWDSGRVGFIYCSLDKAQKEWGSFKNGTGWDATSDNPDYQGKTLREWVAYCLEGEVETYDAFLTGDVVGFVAKDWDGEQIDSCWGYYPDHDVPYRERFDYPISEAKAAIDYHIKKYGETANLNEAEH